MSELTNNERLCQVAKALEEINAEVLYVGGAVIQLYSTEDIRPNPITTYDVDCVLDISSYEEYERFEQRLYGKRFRNDTEEGAPICRYVFNGEKVDFMPKVDTEIGESNRWYPKGIIHRQPCQLDTGERLFIMPVSFFLASKLDALHSRGGNDYRGEKDFEDIVFVLNTCEKIAEEVSNTDDEEVKDYLRSEFSRMLGRPNLREEVESALLEEDRCPIVIERMRKISSETPPADIH